VNKYKRLADKCSLQFRSEFNLFISSLLIFYIWRGVSGFADCGLLDNV